ncbi:MAG: ATP-dependent metallopeptidase FtsH/Yme1/Tma family protein, partial [Actinomycetota bacterium]|nr:ATP-dependent metallopeptidase FtsH/Yme1/Tma family protein [Actinomycetota bacterium]
MAQEQKKGRRAPGPGKAMPPRDGESGPFDPQQRRTTLTWIALALLVFFVAQTTLFPGPTSIPFSRFLDLVDEGRVTEADISEGSVAGTYTTGEGEEEETTEFTSTIPPNYEVNDLVDELREQDVSLSGSQPSPWANLLFGWILPFGLIALLYYFFIYRRLRQQLGGQGGPLSLGKNKAKLYDRTDLKTTFDDVAGVDEVEAELQELV